MRPGPALGAGVATGVGAYLAIVPLAVLSTLVVWAAIFYKTRMVSLASIVATALVPVWGWIWYGLVLGQPLVMATMVSVAVGCIIIIAKHHENIRRLAAGTESRFERSRREGAS